MKKIIFYVIICLLTMTLLISCEKQSHPETEDSTWLSFTCSEAELAEFTLIRPEFAEDYVIRTAQMILKSIEAKSDIRLTLKSDWVKPGEQIPEGTKEILIGSTNRPESGIIEAEEYRVEYMNGRIVIQGGDENSLTQAAVWFLENCVTDTLMLPEEIQVR